MLVDKMKSTAYRIKNTCDALRKEKRKANTQSAEDKQLDDILTITSGKPKKLPSATKNIDIQINNTNTYNIYLTTEKKAITKSAPPLIEDFFKDTTAVTSHKRRKEEPRELMRKTTGGEKSNFKIVKVKRNNLIMRDLDDSKGQIRSKAKEPNASAGGTGGGSGSPRPQRSAKNKY